MALNCPVDVDLLGGPSQEHPVHPFHDRGEKYNDATEPKYRRGHEH